MARNHKRNKKMILELNDMERELVFLLRQHKELWIVIPHATVEFEQKSKELNKKINNIAYELATGEKRHAEERMERGEVKDDV